MTEKELTDLRVQLYKATPLKLQLADELKHLIEGCFGNHIVTNGIRFDSSSFKLDGLYVKMVMIDPEEIGNVLVHWSQDGKYCSIYMLKVSDIRRIIQHIGKMHEHYNSNRQR